MRNDPEIRDIPRPTHIRKVVFSLWRGPIETGGRWLMTEILEDVAKAYDVSEKELLGPSVRRPASIARQHAMWLMKQEPGRSLSMVGNYFGRHHTTALHGITAHEARMRDRSAEHAG